MNEQETDEIWEMTDQEIEHVTGGQGVIATSPLSYRSVGNPNELGIIAVLIGL